MYPVKYLRHIIYLAIIPFLVMTGCHDKKVEGLPTVTVTLPPEAWLAREITGERMNVHTLLPLGSNPETYDPTIGDIRRLAGSDLILVSGTMEFEKKISKELPENIPVEDLSEGIKFLYDTHGHSHKEDDIHDRMKEGGNHITLNPLPDPHVWSSVKNARVISSNILSALSKADPDGIEYYRKNAERLNDRLDSLEASYSARLSEMRGRSFLIWHPSLSYLARDYGLKQQFIGMENKEQSVKSFKSSIDSVRESSPVVMFVQPEYDTPSAYAIARELGLPTVTINPLNPDWIGEMRRILDAITISHEQ